MIDALSSALSGIQSGQSRLARAAQAVAGASFRDEGTPPAPGDDLAGNLLEAKLASHDVKIGVRLARTASEMSDSLLDVIA